MIEVIEKYSPIKWTIARCFKQLDDNICFRRYEETSLFVSTEAKIIVNYGINPGSSTRYYEMQWYFPFRVWDTLTGIEERINK